MPVLCSDLNRRMHMGKIVVIIQARMGSTRLPGKVMMKLCGKTVLAHVIGRVSQSQSIDEIVIATTTNSQDDVIVTEGKKTGVKVFRGSEDNVLERYYLAAKEHEANIVVRITSDCPLIDPQVIEKMLWIYSSSRSDFVTNAGPISTKRTFPRGLDVEVFSNELLTEAFQKSVTEYQKEHVTPYMYENRTPQYFFCEKDYSSLRLTVDVEEDLMVVREIYKRLYRTNSRFSLTDILDVCIREPWIMRLNENVKQKND